MIRVPVHALEWLARKGWWARPSLLVRDISEAPDEAELQEGTLFREVRDGHAKWAHFSCPRCSEHICISIAAGQNSWKLDVDRLWRPTLNPSIWQTGSCGAHFFVRRGQLIWCAD